MDRAARPLRAVRRSSNGRGGVDVEEFDLFDELFKCRRRQSSSLVEHEFALLEGHQCWNRPDLSRRREFLLRFGVDLCKYHVGVLLGGAANVGANDRQGRHHDAQKSTRTMSLPLMMSLNWSAVMS
jgi:hypothetical protein